MKLLREVGIPYQSDRPGIDETTLKLTMHDIPPEDWAKVLAERKAQSLCGRFPGHLILGADQTLILDGCIIDKPNSLDEATEQLRKLRNRTHRLKTAAAISCDDQIIWTATDEATIDVRDFSDQFLDSYLSKLGAEVFTTVGAYKYEALGAQLFSRTTGDYFTILGLPLWPLMNALRRYGVLDS